MKIHRFIDNFDLPTGQAGLSKNELEIQGETAHQIIKVLKLKVGEKIELCDGKGISTMALIVKLGKNNVWVKISNIVKEKTENKKVTLYCAVLKKENFELVVQKTTETGVSKIVPIITDRTIKTGLNLERLKKIAREASEQSGRTDVPEISEPITFDKALDISEGENILFDASGEKFTDTLKNNFKEINIWIGPEGGWTENEIKKARNLPGFKICSLGSNILRAETAAVVSVFLFSQL